MFLSLLSNVSVVCPDHFLVEDYNWTHVRKVLKHSAVPSVFNWKQLPALCSGKQPTDHSLHISIFLSSVLKFTWNLHNHLCCPIKEEKLWQWPFRKQRQVTRIYKNLLSKISRVTCTTNWVPRSTVQRERCPHKPVKRPTEVWTFWNTAIWSWWTAF